MCGTLQLPRPSSFDDGSCGYNNNHMFECDRRLEQYSDAGLGGKWVVLCQWVCTSNSPVVVIVIVIVILVAWWESVGALESWLQSLGTRGCHGPGRRSRTWWYIMWLSTVGVSGFAWKFHGESRLCGSGSCLAHGIRPVASDSRSQCQSH